MADSSTRQAIKMISKISNGRGYSIPFDVGLEVDGCFDKVVILRPMKDMLAKEMGMYNRLHGIDHDVTAPFNWGTYMPPKSSIERLTEGKAREDSREANRLTVLILCRLYRWS
jgi:hypothetical protein